MYAVVATGGKQYKVCPGDKVRVEKIEGNVGDKVTLDKVLYISETDNAVGTPYVSGASVETEISKQGKGKKIIVYHYKPKDGYHKKNGHRQLFTELTILNITKDGAVLAKYDPEEAARIAAEEEAKKEAEEAAKKEAEEAAKAAEEAKTEDAAQTEEVKEEAAEAAPETEQAADEVKEEVSGEQAEEAEQAPENASENTNE